MIGMTMLEVRCALTIMRHARDELRDRQLMLMTNVLKPADKATSDAALELENRIYVVQTVCQKLWVELHALEVATAGTGTFSLLPTQRSLDGENQE